MQTAHAQQFTFTKDHDALLVKDLDSAAAFYSEILGLKEIDNAGLGPKFRWFELDNKVQIHLIESSEEFTPHKGVHLALNVNDLDAFMEFLKQKKIPFENWPGEAGTTNTRPDGVRQIYLKDPDGYWIEVNTNTL
ncbi:VOC family protein [Leeuwenhoekiella parthenopeia]|uniref:VOC family protein n=1 Tax=Leeuwenhoekiella parthenopeia TaxID=2890320 RepID=A0ABS8GW25_9FLAO|nr:VOC family protein [Leeuwenhoekiella parthenopeia]MCC4214152.1 VOC family protein [Leeuwenhoekiella parthenopeia]